VPEPLQGPVAVRLLREPHRVVIPVERLVVGPGPLPARVRGVGRGEGERLDQPVIPRASRGGLLGEVCDGQALRACP
jgi:hypothetical protein